ncbi:DNA repair protein RecN [Candidatus Hakubella thermalkaliphila]|uniref:DNA repair protein RecN n=1 Tax=Candidatus Hakubella thermalkaliphila TaxID=2754717 RepID=A0A6V8Q5K0_9ACTN|nr:DNA repair protein RecN [Candidatus Hakubella thermalkaliphila]GFP38636.1 DNA repair protein RecN (Recombination protein N) [Candidatus Hakubella thermalkaliphila]GFP42548.1 DNA repair protein RecN (Recombination protein N) [Candidatus Hakubella thermalkaliphila]
MLKELLVRNLALIEELNITLPPGLIILSGETGAGKTLMVEALNLALGERADSSMIQTGKEVSYVEAVFDLTRNGRARQLMEEKEITEEKLDQVSLGREICRSGRSRSFIGGRIGPLSWLAELGEILVDLHGQHEHQSLLKVKNHLDLFDRFGGDKIGELRSEYQRRYEKFRDLERELQDLLAREKERYRTLERLKFEREEIERANLKVGEEDSLKSEKKILDNYEKLFLLVNQSLAWLKEGEESAPGALDGLDQVAKNLEDLSQIDEKLGGCLETVMGCRYQLEDVARELRSYVEGIVFDPSRLEMVESRLAEIHALKRKYGDSIEDILSFLENIKGEIKILENYQSRLEEIEGALDKERRAARDLALSLSQARRSIKEEFERKVIRELKDLNLNDASFQVSITHERGEDLLMEDGPWVSLLPHGMDKIEFLISTNVGEPLKPLAKVASGGEISRIMLAMKIVLADADDVPTLIFDEIDVGIGGSVSFLVGEKLAQLSRSHQVICITHLPQIGCFADAHFSIRKSTKSGRARTEVVRLSEEERTEEISRMLGGDRGGDISLDHARELISFAEKRKKSLDVPKSGSESPAF